MKISRDNKTKLNITFTMLALAMIALATATYAWFSLSLSTKVNTIDMEVTAGTHLKIDLQEHASLDQYKSEITSDDIKRNTDLDKVKLDPLTSGDGKNLYLENQTTAVAKDKYKYFEFDLYFMGSAPMDIYLTEDSSQGNTDGTKVTSDGSNTSAQADVAKCVRISFESGSTTKIYEPNKNGSTTLVPPASTDGSGTTQSTFDGAKTGEDASKLFSLTSGKLKEKVTVRVWIEGQDGDCKDAVMSAKFATQLRFEGKE